MIPRLLSRRRRRHRRHFLFVTSLSCFLFHFLHAKYLFVWPPSCHPSRPSMPGPSRPLQGRNLPFPTNSAVLHFAPKHQHSQICILIFLSCPLPCSLRLYFIFLSRSECPSRPSHSDGSAPLTTAIFGWLLLAARVFDLSFPFSHISISLATGRRRSANKNTQAKPTQLCLVHSEANGKSSHDAAHVCGHFAQQSVKEAFSLAHLPFPLYD